jgi:mannose-6-phosphate isomerase-like protein (cupin superfamily)
VVRTTAEAETEVWNDPVRGHVAFQVLISRDRTATSSLCTGLAELPLAGWLGRHRHTQAEVYHVLGGTGVVVLDGAEHAVTGGSVVFVPGDTEHGIRNTGGEPLRFVYAFATDSVEDVVYRFSADA